MADGQQGQALAVREHGGIDRRTDRAAFEPETMEQALALASKLCAGGLVPTALRRPEAALTAIIMGRELGLTAMQSVRSIHVIEGKPSMSSALIVALCKRSTDVCRYFRLVESTDAIATYETHRVGEPEPTRMSFTIRQAQTAGVTGKGNWKAYPAAMLRARCETALARAVYPDLVMGLYDPDELEPAPHVERDVTPPRAPVVTVETPAAATPAPAATTKANYEPADEPAPDDVTGEVAVSFAARSLLEKLAGATTRKELTAVAGQINDALRAGEVSASERETVLVPAYKVRMGEVRS